MADCLFCAIMFEAKLTNPRRFMEDEHTFAFGRPEPARPEPTVLIGIREKHITGLKEAAAEDANLVGTLSPGAGCTHRAANVSIEDGYRTGN